jgi:putative transposase
MTATLQAATLDAVASKKKAAASPELEAARELVRLTRKQGLALIGPDGLLKQLTKTVLETALNEELTEHVGHEKHEPSGSPSGNVRNGIRSKTVLTEASGHVFQASSSEMTASATTFGPSIIKSSALTRRWGRASSCTRKPIFALSIPFRSSSIRCTRMLS